MLTNVIDRRNNPYNTHVDAMIESTCNDNSMPGATQYPIPSRNDVVKELNDTTVSEAIRLANSFDTQVTVYLYDLGSNTVT